jgi:hypothetical protein
MRARRRFAFAAMIACSCVRTEHRDPGPSVAPANDVYAVDGVVMTADLVGTPIRDARIAVLDGEHVVSGGVSDMQGRFTVSTWRRDDAPPRWVRPVPAASMAYRYHRHWRAQLRIEALGFESERIEVDVPRPMTAEPVMVSLRPR